MVKPPIKRKKGKPKKKKELLCLKDTYENSNNKAHSIVDKMLQELSNLGLTNNNVNGYPISTSTALVPYRFPLQDEILSETPSDMFK
jgi:hypothetical protein